MVAHRRATHLSSTPRFLAAVRIRTKTSENPSILRARQWMVEQMCRITRGVWDQIGRLRYFNAAAPIRMRTGEPRPETHLIPLVLQCRCRPPAPYQVFAPTTDTPDGTCIRDYIHAATVPRSICCGATAVAGRDRRCITSQRQRFFGGEVIETARAVTGPTSREIRERRRRPAGWWRMRGGRVRTGWEPRYADLARILPCLAWETPPSRGAPAGRG